MNPEHWKWVQCDKRQLTLYNEGIEKTISNEEGFGYKRWHDHECNLLYKNMIIKKVCW